MSTVYFAPIDAASGEVIKLAMQRLSLTGQVLPAGARLEVKHAFQSSEGKPLEVIYCFPLPRDATLRRFRITGDGFETHSELRPREEAVKAYEAGVAQGSLSAITLQYGDGLVNLTVGNIRPKETVTVHLELLCGVELWDNGFQLRFPFTLAPAYHSRAKTAVVNSGEGEIELPSGEFGDLILPRFKKDASALHEVGFELAVVSPGGLDEVGSASHKVRVMQNDGSSARVGLAEDRDVPNRDLVLETRYKSIETQVFGGRDSHGKSRFAAVIPSVKLGTRPDAGRRVVILLDRSGSMAGEALQQAQRAIEACLGSLSEKDYFGLAAFSNDVMTFKPSLVPGSRKFRDEAHGFLLRIDARGGTELAKGIHEVAKLFGHEGGDIFLITDGQVFSTEKILADAKSVGARLHCLGIGNASQDRFLAQLARETGGVSRFVTTNSRVDMTAVDLFASVARPVVSGLKASPNVEPAPPSAVYAGTPLLLFGTSNGEPLDLSWDGGSLRTALDSLEADCGETVWLLQGARLITDWESRYPAGQALKPLEQRQQNRVAARLAELSSTYGLASREMCLVAVVARQGDRPGALPETRVVPVGVPEGVTFGSYFAKADLFAAKACFGPLPQDFGDMFGPATATMPRFSASESSNKKTKLFKSKKTGVEETLLTLASRLEPDGGLPGNTREARTSASLIALLTFVSEGHTLTDGAFREHVRRLVSFLGSIKGLSADRRRTLVTVLEMVDKGVAPKSNWLTLIESPDSAWAEIERAVACAATSRSDTLGAGSETIE